MLKIVQRRLQPQEENIITEKQAGLAGNRMFSLSCLFFALIVSHIGFDGGTFVLIAPAPDNCLPYTFLNINDKIPCN